MKRVTDLQARRIKALRQVLGLSFADIAGLEGLPTSTVVYYASGVKINENGRRKILRQLADAIVLAMPGDFPIDPPVPNVTIVAAEQAKDEVEKQTEEKK